MVERLEIEVWRRALGADDDIEALVRPDRSPVIGQTRKLQLQGLEFGLLAGKLAFKGGGARPRVLRLPPKLRLLLRRRILEARTDGIPLGAQPIDFRLAGAHFGVERQHRVQIEIDVLDRDRALDRLAIGSDEIQAQHGRCLAEVSRSATAGNGRGSRAADRAPRRSSP